MTYDQVDTAKLLTELRECSKEGPAEVLRRAVREQLAVFEAAAAVLNVQRFPDVAHLFQDIGVIQIMAKETGDDVVCFLIAVIHHKPTWRIRQEQQSNHDDNGEERLEGHRKTPLDRSAEEIEPVVDPVCLPNIVSRSSCKLGSVRN